MIDTDKHIDYHCTASPNACKKQRCFIATMTTPSNAIAHTDTLTHTHSLTQTDKKHTNKQTITPLPKVSAACCSKLLRCAGGSRTSGTNGSQRTQSKDKLRQKNSKRTQDSTFRDLILLTQATSSPVTSKSWAATSKKKTQKKVLQLYQKHQTDHEQTK